MARIIKWTMQMNARNERHRLKIQDNCKEYSRRDRSMLVFSNFINLWHIYIVA